MRQRKNILFLSNHVPYPPNKGEKIRTFHQLDHLALFHRVYCACFVNGRGEWSNVESLRRWCADLIALRWKKRSGLAHAAEGWLRGRPLSVSAYRDRRMEHRLAQWAGQVEFDAVVAFSSAMAPYALAIPAKRRVLDLCDVDSQKWSDYARSSSWPWSAIYRGEGLRLGEYERRCLQLFDAVVLISERERELLDPQGRCSSIQVIPNGTTLYSARPSPASQNGPVIGFVGTMEYRPNVEGVRWFVREVWPRVRREVPEARFVIVGRRPSRRVRRLARVSGVEVTGEVKDVPRYLASFRAVVAPLRIARGLQNKVLEAMAMRRPVVATSGTVAAMRATPEHHILVADDAQAFADKVIALCRYDGLCDKIGDGGYRCMAAHHSWAELLQRYERVVLGLPMGSASTVSRSAPVERSAWPAAEPDVTFTRSRRCETERSAGIEPAEATHAVLGSSMFCDAAGVGGRDDHVELLETAGPAEVSRLRSPFATMFRRDAGEREEHDIPRVDHPGEHGETPGNEAGLSRGLLSRALAAKPVALQPARGSRD